ncbi:MAG: c-type cytochrome [Alphaproteobacteria bacterium]
MTKPIRHGAAALSAIALTILCTAPASAANAQNGLKLARQWCSSCHAVETGQSPESDKAPPFSEIAARRDDKWIKTWLENPHPPMQGITLTHGEIADLMAYIKSLAPKTP